MCSISGVVLFPKNRSPAMLEEIDLFLKGVIVRAEERGRDACGVVVLSGKEVLSYKSTKRASLFVPRLPQLIARDTTIVINNDRNAPSTEGFSRTQDDVQPFDDGKIWVAHNGILWNDKQVKHDFKIKPKSSVDTALIPYLLSKFNAINFGTLRAVFTEVLKGSFACAIFDSEKEALFLLRDFQPLVLAYHSGWNCLFFSSEVEYLTDTSVPDYLTSPLKVWEPQPYSIIRVGTDGKMTSQKLQSRGNKRALIICSGGLDSVTAATWMKKVEGCDITLVHFLYSCRAEEAEKRAIVDVARELECDYRFEDLSWLGKLGGSNLTDRSLEIAEGELGAESADSWVPNRNAVMMSMAGSLCDRFGFGIVTIGNNLEESSAYCDNSTSFYHKMDEVFNLGTLSRPIIRDPLRQFSKHEIVREAIRIGAPIHRSYSCYHSGPLHCNSCGPCLVPGSMVETFDGVKPIESIQVGDLVLTHRGRYSSVTRRFERVYDGMLVEVQAFALRPVRMTLDHPVLLGEEWVPAGSLDVDSRVEVPRVAVVTTGSVAIDGISFDEELAWICGFYVAEGGADRTCSTVKFSVRDPVIIDRIRVRLSEFGVNARYNKKLHQLWCPKAFLFRWFVRNFGARVYEKKLPLQDLLSLPVELQEAFIRGYYAGDGSHPGLETYNQRFDICTVSRQLAFQLRRFFVAHGILPALRERYCPISPFTGERKKRGNEVAYLLYFTRTPYTHQLLGGIGNSERKPRGPKYSVGERMISQQLREVRRVQYSGLVYNLEVAEDNSYVTEFAVHNCFMRMTAFKMNNWIDPMEYEKPPSKKFWHGCEKVYYEEGKWYTEGGECLTKV